MDSKEMLLQAQKELSMAGGVFYSGADNKLRRVLYADHLATSQPVKQIDAFLESIIGPYHANAHSATSSAFCAHHCASLLSESRSIIRTALRASEEDVVCFTGHGATAASNLAVRVLSGMAKRRTQRLAVIVGPMEHHSNILPWREMDKKLVHSVTNAPTIVDSKGNVVIDMEALDKVLAGLSTEAQSSRLAIIGAFSAGSNVTGEFADVLEITKLIHKHKGLAVWDYTAVAPYVSIDMHPVGMEGVGDIDVLFFSGHKFLGGPGTPGVLAARKDIFDQNRPVSPGGGTVLFVDKEDQVYHTSEEEREESGSPDVMGIVKLGLCMKMREDISTKVIMERNREILKMMKDIDLGENVISFPNTGSSDDIKDRLPVLSFVTWNPQTEHFLHHDFVCAVLNDFFGIQARGGCLCAAPYVWNLLQIPDSTVEQFRNALIGAKRAFRELLGRERDRADLGIEVYRPGLVRISFHYAMTDDDVHNILSAVKFIAENGWKLLPLYEFIQETGTWRLKTWRNAHDANTLWIGAFSLGKPLPKPIGADSTEGPLPFDQCLAVATSMSEKCFTDTSKRHVKVPPFPVPDEFKELRWFSTPYDAAAFMGGLPKADTSKPLFCHSRLGIVDKSDSSVEAKPEEKKDSVVDAVVEESVLGSVEAEPEGKKKKKEKKKKGNLPFETPPRTLLHQFIDAIETFKMIHEGDRVLVCVSGGKDSLTMLHLMGYFQDMAAHIKPPLHFTFGAATIDPQEPSFHPQPLEDYMKTLGVSYRLQSEPVMESATRVKPVSLCAFCSRVKRGSLYSVARELGYNVLALGQHLDDAAESFFMSMFRNGFMRTMKANYTVEKGDLRVIRPLIFMRERNIAEFATKCKLPIIWDNCPACFRAPTERHRVKQLLASQESIIPGLFSQLKRALMPLMGIDDVYGEKAYNWMKPKEKGKDDDDDDEE